MMTLDEYHHAIRSREDFIAFVHALSRDLHANRDAWDNNTLERFIEALGAWVEDMDGYYINQGKPAPQQPDWKILGDILMAAKVYE